MSSAGKVARHGSTGTKGLLAWAFYDWANSGFPTLIQTFVFATYFTNAVAADPILAQAQWGNMLGLTGLLVALGGPVLGAVADHTGRRKPWIFGFTALCVAATASLWLVRPDPSWVWPGLVLVALGTFGVEYASIFYNAMLANLAPPERIGRWSGWGWGIGYMGGLACLLLALFLFVQPDPPLFGLNRAASEHVRATFLLVAAWFTLFSLPLFLWTPDTPATGEKFTHAAKQGVRQLLDSIRHVRRYSHIVRFLIARMIYTEGVATMFLFGAIFASRTFKLDQEQVLWFGIALNVTAGIGAVSFAWLDDRLGSKETVLLSLVGLIIFGSGMLLAPSVKVFWAFGLVLGIFVGPVQAASRSLLARMAPDDLRNQMFGLYAFSGKATSFLGPILVSTLTYVSKNERIGMSAIIVLFLVGGLLLWTVPAPRTALQPQRDRDFTGDELG